MDAAELDALAFERFLSNILHPQAGSSPAFPPAVSDSTPRAAGFFIQQEAQK